VKFEIPAGRSHYVEKMNADFVRLLWILILGGITTGKPLANSLSIKRIISEWRDINKSGLDLSVPFNTSDIDESGIRLSPLKSNFLEWHFSFVGMKGSSFEEGIYHGKIILHPDYPRKAPTITMSTPSGRWEINTPICLSASAHHQELWNPDWNLRTLVLSLRTFMTTQPGEIASISSTPEVHRRLAQLSKSFICTDCGMCHDGGVDSKDLSKIKLCLGGEGDIVQSIPKQRKVVTSRHSKNVNSLVKNSWIKKSWNGAVRFLAKGARSGGLIVVTMLLYFFFYL
jgi:ubiquitin-protein ligase